MSTDASLLSFLAVRDNYVNYYHHIKLNALCVDTAALVRALEEYYTTVHTDLDLNAFLMWYLHYKNPECPPSKSQIYRTLIEEAIQAEMLLASDVLQSLYIASAKDKILEIVYNTPDIFPIREVLDDLEANLQVADSPHHVVNDLERLVSSEDRSHGLRWRLNCLNKALGPLIKGDMVVAAAYVNTGKTAFAISETVNMAMQLKEGRVLWFNNEEFDDRVLSKIWSCTLKASWEKILQNKDQAKMSYIKRMNGDLERIKMFDIRGLSIQGLRKICSAEDAKLIIVDQLDNVVGGAAKDAPDYLRRTGLYKKMRELANSICPIIAVTQADATTRWQDRTTGDMVYQKYLDMSQLDGSKVGKQAAVDVILTIGQDVTQPNIRYLHAAKNKLRGEDPLYRSFKQPVMFDGELCLYTDENMGD